jgi:hypothetical protein
MLGEGSAYAAAPPFGLCSDGVHPALALVNEAPGACNRNIIMEYHPSRQTRYVVRRFQVRASDRFVGSSSRHSNRRGDDAVMLLQLRMQRRRVALQTANLAPGIGRI